MLNLVWFNLALRVWLPCVKNNRLRLFFYFVVKGWGLELRSALQLSKRVQAQGEAKPKQKSSLFVSTFLFFLGWRKGFLLTVCLQLRAKRSRASPSFTSRFALVTVWDRPSPMPSPTPLHVRGGGMALLYEQSIVNWNQIYIFKVRISVSKICKLDFKFEYKELRRSIVRWFLGFSASQARSCKQKKLKFDEDKVYSLSSQILTKSAKSARETSLNQ